LESWFQITFLAYLVFGFQAFSMAYACLTPKIPQNPKWVIGILGRLPQLKILIFFYVFFIVDSINHNLLGVIYFIAF
jgi:hypothetical protein